MGVKYKINEDFFKTWSSEMAYVLGFIVADGSLENASYLRGKYLRICSRDREILEKIRKAMLSEHTLVTIPPQEVVKRGKSYISKEKYLLRIGSHRIYNDLLNRGIVPRKSKTITMPHIPLPFVSHFVRGYLDGDGCVYRDARRRRLEVIFTSGSALFLKELSALIGLILDSEFTHVLSNSQAYQIRYSTSSAMPLLKYLYADAGSGLYLERKRHIFLEFLEGSAQGAERGPWN